MSNKYFIHIGTFIGKDGKKRTQYLAFSGGQGSTMSFYADSITTDTISRMEKGTFKYMGTLEEMTEIMQKYYKYRGKNKRFNEPIRLQRCSIWIKANKRNIK